MIDFEFQVDERVLAEDMSADPGDANAAALQETYFEMPVRLAVDGTELLEADGITVAPWLPIPLLDAARLLPELVEGLGDGEKAVYSLPGGGWSLEMIREGENIELRSTVNGRHALVGYAELKQACNVFREQVRSMLTRKVPALRGHTEWGRWIDGGS